MKEIIKLEVTIHITYEDKKDRNLAIQMAKDNLLEDEISTGSGINILPFKVKLINKKLWPIKNIKVNYQET